MRLVIATRNTHKAGEICAILSHKFDFLTLRDFPEAPETIEDAPTFEGNAAKKAATLAQWLVFAGKLNSGFVLADDSGLEVDALGGAPGVHSARFAFLDDPKSPAGQNSPDQANNAKLLRLLEKVPDEQRTARFRCVLALIDIGPQTGKTVSEIAKTAEFFLGTCEGRVAFAPGGAGGFGYDPLFIPNGYDRSFAELGEELKNTMSHRAKALQELRSHFAARP
jgi:XTP/dITP diphosphohydrolase